jgi:hypothetical protein
MPFPNTVTVLLTLLLAGMVIGPCAGVADNADAGNQDRIVITLSISNNASEKNDLNRTTGREAKPWNSAPSSNLKKGKVPKVNESTEQQKEGFSDRDWAYIRKSMTDLTEKEQDRLIAEMKKILNHTSSLRPDEQNNVSFRMGYYIINATDGGKPVNSSDLPGLPAETPMQTAAAIPLAIPLIAIGGGGILRLLLLRDDKK